MKPDEFWNLTPAELGDLAAGYSWRWERYRELAAWVVSYLLAPHCKDGNGPSVDSLLGRDQGNTVQLPDGMVATGDPQLITALVGSPDDQEERLRLLWEKVQQQRQGADT